MSNTTKPLISVITVTYNAEPVLERTIKSVISQSYDYIEYIVIDGGSTDGTIECLKKYNDYIGFWKSEADRGIYDAMNKSLSYAKGDWIYFLGAGDLLHNIIHEMAPLFVDTNTLYYGDVYRHDLNAVYDGKFSAFKLAVNNICHQAIFYPKSALSKYKYDERYRVFADHILNMYVYGDKQFKFKYLPVIVCDYEGDGFSVRSTDAYYIAHKLKVIKSNFAFWIYAYAFIRRKMADIKEI